MALEKHIAKNKATTDKFSKMESKLSFPVVFASIELPSKVNIEQQGKVV